MSDYKEHPDYQIRSWVLDCAVEANKRGTKHEKILSDAKAFYGFLFPENGKVEYQKFKEGSEK